MATEEEYKRAIEAVRACMATEEQIQLAMKMAQQAGKLGNAARAAFRGEK